MNDLIADLHDASVGLTEAKRTGREAHPGLAPVSNDQFPPIKGLEGPFRYKSGRILYYDPKIGKYYDRKNDLYLDKDEVVESATSGTNLDQVARLSDDEAMISLNRILSAARETLTKGGFQVDWDEGSGIGPWAVKITRMPQGKIEGAPSGKKTDEEISSGAIPVLLAAPAKKRCRCADGSNGVQESDFKGLLLGLQEEAMNPMTSQARCKQIGILASGLRKTAAWTQDAALAAAAEKTRPV